VVLAPTPHSCATSAIVGVLERFLAIPALSDQENDSSHRRECEVSL